MIRHCTPEDEFIGDGDNRCGLEFDDVERSTICPHEILPKPISESELDKVIKELKQEGHT